MAKITVAGTAVIVTSALKLDDIKLIEKYRPDALVLKGGEDGNDPVFRIATTTEGHGSINRLGVEFDSATDNEEKLAAVTVIREGGFGENVKATVSDAYGLAVLNLNKLERQLEGALREIAEEKAAIDRNITVLL